MGDAAGVVTACQSGERSIAWILAAPVPAPTRLATARPRAGLPSRSMIGIREDTTGPNRRVLAGYLVVALIFPSHDPIIRQPSDPEDAVREVTRQPASGAAAFVPVLSFI